MSAPRRALVIIDVQQEYFDGPLAIQYPPRDTSLDRIIQTIGIAKQSNMPVVVVQHNLPEGAPVFATGSTSWDLHPEVKARTENAPKHVLKSFASIFASTDLTEWLRENDIDTVTLVGYMTNNCVLGSAAAAEPLGFNVEVLSDATGAIHFSNEAGSVSAQQVHETLMTVLHSNWAAVAGTDEWNSAVQDGRELPKSNLVVSALQGQEAHNA